jgi:hypothetical protein
MSKTRPGVPRKGTKIMLQQQVGLNSRLLLVKKSDFVAGESPGATFII